MVTPVSSSDPEQQVLGRRLGLQAAQVSSTPAAAVRLADVPFVEKPWKSPKAHVSTIRLEYSDALEKIA